MPTFYFKAPEDVWDPNSGDGMEFANLQQAIEEARSTICELATTFLPGNPMDTISIFIHDANGVKHTEVRLILKTIPNCPEA